MHIAVSGIPGSGKSTFGRELTKCLNLTWDSEGSPRRVPYQYVSGGKMFREVARQKNLSVQQLSELMAESDWMSSRVNDAIDSTLRETCDGYPNLVIDARSAFALEGKGTVKTLMLCDIGRAARRILASEREGELYASEDTAIKGIEGRIAFETEEMDDLFGIDPYSLTLCDVAVDTTREVPVTMVASYFASGIESAERKGLTDGREVGKAISEFCKENDMPAILTPEEASDFDMYAGLYDRYKEERIRFICPIPRDDDMVR